MSSNLTARSINKRNNKLFLVFDVTFYWLISERVISWLDVGDVVEGEVLRVVVAGDLEQNLLDVVNVVDQEDHVGKHVVAVGGQGTKAYLVIGATDRVDLRVRVVVGQGKYNK